jgi:hypothetical protein
VNEFNLAFAALATFIRRASLDPRAPVIVTIRFESRQEHAVFSRAVRRMATLPPHYTPGDRIIINGIEVRYENEQDLNHAKPKEP